MPRRALITGGTGSVGEALVRQFTAGGFAVTFQYATNRDRAAELESETGATALQLDFMGAVSLTDSNFDVVINCAGINVTSTRTAEISNGEMEATLSVNLVAPFQIIRSVLPYMMERRWGRVINIGSIYSLRASTNNCSYNISKHGLVGLTKSIAVEYASFGITANDICPSAIESELMQRIAVGQSQETDATPEEFLEGVRRANPAERMALPTDVASTAWFLASDEASFINGTAIVVDGGQIA